MEYDCPDAEVCKSCVCAGEDDVCFPGERLREERNRYRKALERVANPVILSAHDLRDIAREALT